MNYVKLLNKMIESKYICIIREDRYETAKETFDLSVLCGFQGIEITLATPDALELIKETSQYHEETIIGAGSVIEPQSAMLAINHGANFIVGPNFNAKIAKLCHTYQIPYIPGCMSINEMLQALEAGCNVVKVFPAHVLGPQFIKSVKGPLPQINMMVTGGVNLDNASTYLENGALMCGIGSSFKKLINDLGKDEAIKKIKHQIKGNDANE